VENPIDVERGTTEYVAAVRPVSEQPTFSREDCVDEQGSERAILLMTRADIKAGSQAWPPLVPKGKDRTLGLCYPASV
jgi:hypothetical protein